MVDAREIVIRLFGDDQFANVFLIGAGFQSGALPLPAEAIEEAIRLNGVAVDTNLQAFRRGRQYVVAPDEVIRSAGRQPVSTDELDSPPEDELELNLWVPIMPSLHATCEYSFAEDVAEMSSAGYEDAVGALVDG